MVTEEGSRDARPALKGKQDIRSFSLDALTGIITGLGEKSFRAKQLYEWLHKKQVDSLEEMKNLPKSLKEKISENYSIFRTEEAEQLVSKQDGTRKFLFRLGDGNIIESVFMKYQHGNSVCISSQAGCRMGCRFCASTLLGLTRNLTAGEMAGQIYAIARATGEKISNVVIMGTGEPLDNYTELVSFLRIIFSAEGMNLSQRNITVSTCGLSKRIRELAGEHFQITLAISLHAPNDALRKTIMPVANKYTIEEVLEACWFYFSETGRRISFEYSLIRGENDTIAHAEELSSLLKGHNCHVNLIPVNPIKERNYKKSEESSVEKFKKILEKNRINVTIRRKMGADIDAACGQLRKRYIEEKE